MKENNFYEVDGCTDFIPVKLIEEHKHMTNTLKVELTETGYITFVPRMYSFQKADEPQKGGGPACIESCIGYAKAEGMSLFIAMDNAQNKESEWIIKHEDTFARAWLDGYEVEKEKLYTVEIPDPNSMYKHRFLSRNDNGVCIGVCMDASNGNNWKQRRENRLTEAEIKQDFEWAWQWAQEVEV